MTTTQLVSMISVTDIERSVEFYRHLGFEVGNTFQPEGATKPSWAWLRSGQAQLMLSAATEPVGQQTERALLCVHGRRRSGVRIPRPGRSQSWSDHEAVLLTTR